MDYGQAVKAHSLWKQKLSTYAAKRDGSLRVADLTADNKCDLGKWIYGEGRSRFGTVPEFVVLTAKHAAFHKAAGDVLRHIDAGTYRSDETMVGGSSPYSAASMECVSAIMALQRKAAA